MKKILNINCGKLNFEKCISEIYWKEGENLYLQLKNKNIISNNQHLLVYKTFNNNYQTLYLINQEKTENVYFTRKSIRIYNDQELNHLNIYSINN
jgi:hypothetical protein